MHIIEALKALDSSRVWTLMENSYESIVWDENDHLPRPTKEEAEMKLQELEAEEPWKHLRTARNSTLSETDWTQTNDIIMENEEEWKEYRQALRDLPSTTEDPENPVWPEPPKVKVTTSGSTTRTELEQALEAEKEKTKNLESRLAFLETAVASLIS